MCVCAPVHVHAHTCPCLYKCPCMLFSTCLSMGFTCRYTCRHTPVQVCAHGCACTCTCLHLAMHTPIRTPVHMPKMWAAAPHELTLARAARPIDATRCCGTRASQHCAALVGEDRRDAAAAAARAAATRGVLVPGSVVHARPGWMCMGLGAVHARTHALYGHHIRHWRRTGSSLPGGGGAPARLRPAPAAICTQRTFARGPHLRARPAPQRACALPTYRPIYRRVSGTC